MGMTGAGMAAALRRAVGSRAKRWRHRRLLHLAQDALQQLEVRRAGGGAAALDPRTVRTIDRALAAMPPHVRACYGRGASVGDAMEGMFAVQRALLRERKTDLLGANTTWSTR